MRRDHSTHTEAHFAVWVVQLCIITCDVAREKVGWRVMHATGSRILLNRYHEFCIFFALLCLLHNFIPQNGHERNFFFSWKPSTCIRSCVLLTRLTPQMSHLNGLFFSCTCWACFLTSLLHENTLEQEGHLKLLPQCTVLMCTLSLL